MPCRLACHERQRWRPSAEKKPMPDLPDASQKPRKVQAAPRRRLYFHFRPKRPRRAALAVHRHGPRSCACKLKTRANVLEKTGSAVLAASA